MSDITATAASASWISVKLNDTSVSIDYAGNWKTKPWIDVHDYGAIGNGVTDDTVAIQAAVDACLALGTGGTVYFRSGKYPVSTINLYCSSYGTYPGKSIRLLGDGLNSSVIIGNTNGEHIIYAVGRSDFALEDFRVETAPGIVCETGLLLARSTLGVGQCAWNTFKNVRIEGHFSKASCVSIASEVNRWWNCWFTNDDGTNNYCCFWTAPDNSIIAVTPNGADTILTSTNTDNTMVGCGFFAHGNNATPIVLQESADYDFIGCEVSPGTNSGCKFATYIATANGFHGKVNWIGTLWEGGASVANVIHYLNPTVATAYYFDVMDIGSNYAMYNEDDHMAIDADDTLIGGGVPVSILYNWKIDNFYMVSQGAATLGIDVDYVQNCDFNLADPAYSTTIDVGTGRTASRLKATTLTIPATETAASPACPESMRGIAVANDGAVTLEKALTLTAGQIVFPATQNASAGANTLDDYEEGTFVPTFTNLAVVGTPTYTGVYTKIGRVVHFTVKIVTAGADTTASTANSTYHNLPFTPANPHPSYAIVNDLSKSGLGIAWTDGNNYTPTWAAHTGTVAISGTYYV